MEVTDLKKKQYMYIAKLGGYLELNESDDINNDLNRAIIKAYASQHVPCYLGNINFYGSKREEFIEQKISCYEQYSGREILNFEYTFIIPLMDVLLEQMIREWNSGQAQRRLIDKIMARIDSLGGLIFIWS